MKKVILTVAVITGFVLIFFANTGYDKYVESQRVNMIVELIEEIVQNDNDLIELANEYNGYFSVELDEKNDSDTLITKVVLNDSYVKLIESESYKNLVVMDTKINEDLVYLEQLETGLDPVIQVIVQMHKSYSNHLEKFQVAVEEKKKCDVLSTIDKAYFIDTIDQLDHRVYIALLKEEK